MTQIVSAQMLKKKTENQSIAAPLLRCSVGSANAAEHRQRRQRQHQRAVDAAHQHAGDERDAGAGQRNRHVALAASDGASATASRRPAAASAR